MSDEHTKRNARATVRVRSMTPRFSTASKVGRHYTDHALQGEGRSHNSTSSHPNEDPAPGDGERLLHALRRSIVAPLTGSLVGHLPARHSAEHQARALPLASATP